MPYDCHQDFNLHCVPLKLFEYFAVGIPVVSTPIIHLWEYGDLVYLGDTAQELAVAIEAALNEPVDSPKRARRMAIAREHSLESLAAQLRLALPMGLPCEKASPAALEPSASGASAVGV
jgi:glycosyltransferase involved in cell wall biosynthesis